MGGRPGWGENIIVKTKGFIVTSEKREVFDALRDGEQLDRRLSDDIKIKV